MDIKEVVGSWNRAPLMRALQYSSHYKGSPPAMPRIGAASLVMLEKQVESR
jgi:hypothetical protein